jgi:hypothetical protein
MIKSIAGMIGGCLFVIAMAICGCDSGDLQEGVPQNTGYVPPKMQPGTMGLKGKPQLGATAKDKAAAKARAEAAPTPETKPD